MSRKWTLTLFAIMVAMVTGYLVFHEPTLKSIPDALKGYWVTDAPRYAKCSIEFHEKAVEIGTSTGEHIFWGVKSITVDARTDVMDYKITYLDSEGVESVLSLRYVPSSGGTLQLENQKDTLWRRALNTDPNGMAGIKDL